MIKTKTTQTKTIVTTAIVSLAVLGMLSSFYYYSRRVPTESYQKQQEQAAQVQQGTETYKIRATMKGASTCDSLLKTGTSTQCGLKYVGPIGTQAGTKAHINTSQNTVTVIGYGEFTGQVCTKTAPMSNIGGILKGEATCSTEGRTYTAYGEKSGLTTSPPPSDSTYQIQAKIIGPDACETGLINGTVASCGPKHITAFDVSSVATINKDNNTVTVRGYDGSGPNYVCTNTVAMTGGSGTASCTAGGRTYVAYGRIGGSAPSGPSCTISFNPNTITKGQTTTSTWSSTGDADGRIQYVCKCADGQCESVNTQYGGRFPDIYEQAEQSASGTTTTFGPPETVVCTATVRNSAGVTNTCKSELVVKPAETGACVQSTKTATCSWGNNIFTAVGVQNPDCTYKIQAKVSGAKVCDSGLISGTNAVCPAEKYISPCLKCCASSWPRPVASIDKITKTLTITGWTGQDGVYGGSCSVACTNSVSFNEEPLSPPPPPPPPSPTTQTIKGAATCSAEGRTYTAYGEMTTGGSATTYKTQAKMSGLSSCDSGLRDAKSTTCGLKYVGPMGTQAGTKADINSTGYITVIGYGEFTGQVCTKTIKMTSGYSTDSGSSTDQKFIGPYGGYTNCVIGSILNQMMGGETGTWIADCNCSYKKVSSQVLSQAEACAQAQKMGICLTGSTKCSSSSSSSSSPAPSCSNCSCCLAAGGFSSCTAACRALGYGTSGTCYNPTSTSFSSCCRCQ